MELDVESNQHAENNQRRYYVRSIIAMAVVWAAVAFYGQTESQWFNNYVVNEIIGTGYSDRQMSWMVSTSAFVGTFAFIYWGILSDNIRTKYGKRVPIYIIGAVLTAIFVILFGKGTSLIWLIICDGVIIGITSNMFHCTNRVLIPDIFPIEKRGHVNFIKEIVSMIATGGIWVLAFYFKNINEEGPGTFTRYQFDFIFGLCALLLILSAIVAFFMIKEPQDTSKPRKISQDIKMIFDVQEMKKHKDFLKLFIASLFVVMSQNAYGPWMLRIIDLLTIPNDINILLLGIIPAAIIATIVISKYNRLVDKIGRKKSTMLALIFIPLACSFIAFSNYNFIIIVISLGTLLSFNMGLSISISTWTQDLLPQESRAKFLGIINIGSAGFQIPGVLIAGIVAETYSVLSIFFVSAIYLLISIPIFLIVPDIYRNTESQKKNREL